MKLTKEIIVYVEQSSGNACDEGSNHVLGENIKDEYKLIGKIDFCGGIYPKIKSSPSSFSIEIQPINIDESEEMISPEIRELKVG